MTKLREVEEKYKEELGLKNERELRVKQLMDAAEAFRMETETKRRAAVRIQAIFRGWQVRTLLLLDCIVAVTTVGEGHRTN